LAVVLSLVVIGGGVAMFVAPSREQAPSRPGAAASAQLVVTTWTKDPTFNDWPYPGYRPAISPITSAMVTGASVARNPAGEPVVQVALDPQGAEIFRKLWVEAAAACPHSDCPQRHLTMWIDLTQDDVAHWDQRAHQLYRPFYQGGKLLTDPLVLSPRSGTGTTDGPTGPSIQIAGNFNQQQAEDLAHRLHP
jgi:preprotein translocase subunit SecD